MNYQWIGLVAASYLVGSIPFALIVGKLWKGIDIRRYGSGNVGATNALRTLGVGPSLIVFACDFAKGALPTWIGWHVGDSLLVGALCALAAVAGHNWSLYIRFTGGKGVTTSLGALFVLSPLAGLLITALGLGVIGVSRYVSLGSLIGAVAGPLLLLGMALLGSPFEPALYGFAAGLLVVLQHRANIGRLLAGKENRLGQKAEVGSRR